MTESREATQQIPTGDMSSEQVSREDLPSYTMFKQSIEESPDQVDELGEFLWEYALSSKATVLMPAGTERNRTWSRLDIHVAVQALRDAQKQERLSGQSEDSVVLATLEQAIKSLKDLQAALASEEASG